MKNVSPRRNEEPLKIPLQQEPRGRREKDYEKTIEMNMWRKIECANDKKDISCGPSTKMNTDINAGTTQEVIPGEIWVPSIRFEEDPDPNDSLTVGISSIRFESCEEDFDAALLVCAKKVSDESDENEADNTSLDNKVSPRGEGPKVIQETWVDQTTMLEVISKIEECGRLKKIGDTLSKGAGDSDTSYEVAPAFKSIESYISYGKAQLFETVESDIGYGLTQLFGAIEHDDETLTTMTWLNSLRPPNRLSTMGLPNCLRPSIRMKTML
ncbi:hypothetical protein CBR_g63112 [Chara braunii]|uniref:Uncharacterized protein n=1 Tax=Chara braunii TaxID=69332 RepID=A0A388K932_CHABU|nr:hypothetical protein CBR_g63112 [Chara braunii]|eukprot:GBG66529.1 hypothetical protein CBR_g63112 [Chara braunii]